MDEETRTYTAFAGHRRVASGDLPSMLRGTKQRIDGGETDRILIFEDDTGRQVDFDLRGTLDEILSRVLDKPKAGPGRPRLGVVSREVTLLPRHWEWLEQQPNGSSAALRRLVDEARKRAPGPERARRAREAASKFMWAMAGDLPGFEEASRALFGKDRARLGVLIRGWPEDVRAHVERLVDESIRLEAAAD